MAVIRGDKARVEMTERCDITPTVFLLVHYAKKARIEAGFFWVTASIATKVHARKPVEHLLEAAVH